MLLSWEHFSGRKTDRAALTAAYRELKKPARKLPAGLTPEESAASGTVPEREFVGQPFCQSLVPYAERRRIELPRLLWTLFDGRRDLLECIRTFDGENGSRSTPEFIGNVLAALRFLEKYGYVRLRSRR